MGEEEANSTAFCGPCEEEETAPSAEEKSVIPPPRDQKPDEPKHIAVLEKKAAEPAYTFLVPTDRYAVLARVEHEKRLSIIKAWEESEKVKVENKAVKKMYTIDAWENTRKATIEAELRRIHENIEKKKAECAEQMKNKIVMIHKEAEEKRAMAEARRGEDVLKAEEAAAKYRESGVAPKKLLGLF